MQAVQTKTKTAHDTDTDLMRIIASFFVVLIHASTAEGMGMVYNALARFSVPVFVLISGYYLLRRPTAGIRIARRIGSLVGIHILWSVLYYVFYRLIGDLPRGNAGDVIRYLLTQPTHLWYLYALAGLWLLLPLLRTFAAHASEGEYRYTLWVTGILGTWVTLGVRSGISGTFSAVVENTKIPYAVGFVFLFLMGGYRCLGTGRHRFVRPSSARGYGRFTGFELLRTGHGCDCHRILFVDQKEICRAGACLSGSIFCFENGGCRQRRGISYASDGIAAV